MQSWKTKNGLEITRIMSGRSNVFLVKSGNLNILIDTSVARLWTKLQSQLAKLGINSIDYLILTHAHFDHAANAKRIKEKFGAKVIIHSSEAGYLSKGDNIIPDGTTLITRPLIRTFGKRAFERLKYEPCKPDILIDHEYDLTNLGIKARLMHTPGHTAGSVSLIVDEEIALVGDAMFGVFKWSVFPPYAQDQDQMVVSWGKLLETRCSMFIPSHGTANSRSLVEKDFANRIMKIQHSAATHRQ